LELVSSAVFIAAPAPPVIGLKNHVELGIAEKLEVEWRAE